MVAYMFLEKLSKVVRGRIRARENNMEKFLLVMTACVNPGQGQYPLKRADPEVRLGDYAKSLRYWLGLPDQRIRNILLIENSNYPLGSLKEIARSENPYHREVELVSLDCNWYPPGGHYGYAELKMLDEGLHKSILRRQSEYMIKVSGRLIFPSLSRLLDKIPADFDAVVDSRKWIGLFRRRDKPRVTTQLVLFKLAFYEKYLQSCYRLLEEGEEKHMEGIYYFLLDRLGQNAAHKILFRFPCNADPAGFPAHRTNAYGGILERSQQVFRAVTRRVLPQWWI